MQRKKYVLLFTLLSFLSFFSLTSVYAASTEGQAEKSASVQTNGTIIFETEESTTNPTIDSTDDSTPTSSSSATELPNAGGGKLPKTGELTKQGLTYGGAVLLLLGMFLFLWKQKRDKQCRRDANQ